MLDREEFERLFLGLYKKWREWGKHTSAYGIGWDIWQEQQKKIDELQEEIEAWKLQDETGNIIITALNDDINNLKAEIIKLKALNPDVPCPVCRGAKHGFTDNGWEVCAFCQEKGKVFLTKAQEYRIKELESFVKSYQRYFIGEDKDMDIEAENLVGSI